MLFYLDYLLLKRICDYKSFVSQSRPIHKVFALLLAIVFDLDVQELEGVVMALEKLSQWHGGLAKMTSASKFNHFKVKINGRY